jgi:hypothetical protein
MIKHFSLRLRGREDLGEESLLVYVEEHNYCI